MQFMGKKINHNHIGNRADNWSRTVKNWRDHVAMEIDWSAFPESAELELAHANAINSLDVLQGKLVEIRDHHWNKHDTGQE